MRLMNEVWRVSLAAMLALGVAACNGGPAGEVLEPEDEETLDGEGKAEAWNQANNPASVDSNFAYYVHQLPMEGHGPVPIPGDYWATQRDTLNHRWDGEESLSPSEKYAKAFNRPDVPTRMTQEHGIESSGAKVCTTSTDCADEKDGSSCAIPRGATTGRCIPGWWGICHGWAPYALMEPAARNPVTKKASDGTDVVFYPGDLEGLMSLIYTDVPTKFLSSRCNKDDPQKDALGRLVDGECRDMNPGSWHVLVTNMMGTRQKGFVIDQTYDDQVWNQPAYGYRITNAVDGKLVELSKAEAISRLGLNLTMTSLLPTGTIKKEEQKTGEYTAAAAGEYIFKTSGTGDVDLYVKKGAAAQKDVSDCSGTSGTAVEECRLTLGAGETVGWLVLGYAESSEAQFGVAVPGASGDYTYNTVAKRFFYVEMEFTFISESSPARTSHIDEFQSYLHTKNYSYILEADEGGKIIGGEWAGGSMTNHPDFAWWPTETAKYAYVAGGLIKYDEVKALNDESAAQAPPAADATVTLMNNVAISTTAGTWKSKYASLTIEAGFQKLEVSMSGTGAAELYVRVDRNPTVWVYGCKSTAAGTATQTCSMTVEAGKTYFVRARTNTPDTAVTVVAKKIK